MLFMKMLNYNRTLNDLLKMLSKLGFLEEALDIRSEARQYLPQAGRGIK